MFILVQSVVLQHQSQHATCKVNFLVNMVRVKRGNVARNRRKKILKFAKGFQGAHSRLFRTANQQVMKSHYLVIYQITTMRGLGAYGLMAVKQ